jgi:hypothetical protein
VSPSAGYIYVNDWDRFQHYKDRRPPWIKNYVDLLDDEDYHDLGAPERALLHGLWMLAAVRGNGRVTADPGYLRSQLVLRKLPLSALVDAGWITIRPDKAPEKGRDWATRYIPDKTRKAVFDRAGEQCVSCGSYADLEIDHIVPVSKGGTSDAANLQALCRRCNRRKHNQYAEQSATQKRGSVLSETETDGSKEPSETNRPRTRSAASVASAEREPQNGHNPVQPSAPWESARNGGLEMLGKAIGAIPAQNGENGANHEKPAPQEPVSAPRADDLDQPLDDIDIPF